MSDPNAARRTRVERNIYTRGTGRSKSYEVGWRDGAGRQRWQTVDGGITAARAVRDDLLTRRRGGERTAPNRRLRFAETAQSWFDGPVADLRETTQAGYRNALERHLLPRFAATRMDAIDADMAVRAIRDMRTDGLSEATVDRALAVLGQVFRYATRRLGYAGPNPVADLLPSERPKPGRDRKRTMFTADQIAQTIRAADAPYRTLFAVAAVTGARVSEIAGLRWRDVDLSDLDEASLTFAEQVDRKGERRPLKTDGSARTVPIPRALASLLARHKLSAHGGQPDSPVFATRTGRPIQQRNISRGLRAAQQRAVDEYGRPSFPELHESDERGRPIKPARGVVPSMHAFRHAVASIAIAEGESADEVAFLLGHKDATVTRQVYVQEIADARRAAARRVSMAERYESALEAADVATARA